MGLEPGELDRAEWPLPSTSPGCHRHKHSGSLLPTAIRPQHPRKWPGLLTFALDISATWCVSCSPPPSPSCLPSVSKFRWWLTSTRKLFLGDRNQVLFIFEKKEKKKMMSEASPSPASSLTMVSFAMLTPSQIQTLPIFIYMTVLGLSYGIWDLLLAVACVISFPDQGLNLGNLHWELGFLATHWTTTEVPSLLSSWHSDFSSNVTSSEKPTLTTPSKAVALSPLPALNQHPVGLQSMPKSPT